VAIIDAQDLGSDVLLKTDVCIVGGGAAGIAIALELARSPLDVCLIESGGMSPDWDTQSLYDLRSTGYPVRENFMSRARYFGGSCNLWAGRSMQLDPFDTGPRPWVGIDGWPVDYGEIAKYFERSADLLELPPLRWFEHQIHQPEMTPFERELFASPALSPTVSLWAKKPKRFGADHKSQLAHSPRVRVVLHGNVTSIDLNAAGSVVDQVQARTLGGKVFRVQASQFVLACGGLENARLLLVSRDHHPNGVGNQFDQVGRYYMDHPRCVSGVVKLRDNARLRVLSGLPFRHGKTQLGIRLSRDMQRREGLLNHYATLEAEVSQYAEAKYQSFVQTMKVLLRRGYAGSRRDIGKSRLAEIPDLIYLLTPKEIVPHPLYRFYWEARQRLPRRQRSTGKRIVVFFCEQPPDPESRVTLCDARDQLGVQQLELRWRLGPEIEKTVLRFQEVLQQRCKETHLGTLEVPESRIGFTDASHHMGTTRMSENPRSGVVDRDCRVHGIDNLFVAGSSVFPSGSHVSPTLAIIALSLRLADRLGTQQ